MTWSCSPPLGIPQVWSNVGRLLLSKLIRNVPTRGERRWRWRWASPASRGNTALHCSPTFAFRSSPLSALYSHPSDKHNLSLLYDFSLIPSCLLPNHLTWHFTAVMNDVLTENFITLISLSPLGRSPSVKSNVLKAGCMQIYNSSPSCVF